MCVLCNDNVDLFECVIDFIIGNIKFCFQSFH